MNLQEAPSQNRPPKLSPEEKEQVGIVLKVPSTRLDHRYYEIKFKGEHVGTIALTGRDPINPHIVRGKNSILYENFRGVGIGKQAYIQINEDLKKLGLVLASNKVDLLDTGKELWESLVKSGEAEKLADGTYKFK
jgi:hypothetical protein